MIHSIEKEMEKRKIFRALWFPLFFIIIIWTVKIIEIYTGNSFAHLGLRPLEFKGLLGIFTSPLIHSNWEHLFNNSIPILFLSWAVFFFYHEVRWKVFLMVWFLTGFWAWFFARDSYHIGASGLIYGFGAFVFVSGLIRRNQSLLAISLLVSFLYGSMIWYVFPIDERISWESHLSGMLAGILLAIYFRNYGPALPIPKILEEDNDEEEENDENAYWNTPDDPEVEHKVD